MNTRYVDEPGRHAVPKDCPRITAAAQPRDESDSCETKRRCDVTKLPVDLAAIATDHGLDEATHSAAERRTCRLAKHGVHYGVNTAAIHSKRSRVIHTLRQTPYRTHAVTYNVYILRVTTHGVPNAIHQLSTRIVRNDCCATTT
jgi:hypothetical protein